MSTIRTPENPTAMWKNVFRYDFGAFAVVASIVSWIITVVWLFDEQMGGLGPRSNVVTKDYFNWHPFLMVTAFLLFMAPAAISFEMYPLARHTNKNIHSILMSLALISAFAGLAIILDCHNNLTSTGSFLTLHGSVGLFTLIIVGLNYIGGFIMYVLKLGGTLRGTLKPLHKRLGLLALLFGMATIAIGVQEKADKGGLTGRALELTYAIGILVYATLGGTVFSIVKFSDKNQGPAKGEPVKTTQPAAATAVRATATDNLVVNMNNPNLQEADETTKLIE